MGHYIDWYATHREGAGLIEGIDWYLGPYIGLEDLTGMWSQYYNHGEYQKAKAPRNWFLA